MSFKVTARTLLHLGAELISSDAVALYELIKNAFDAGSTKGVKIEIIVRLPSWPGEWPHKLSVLEATLSEVKTAAQRQTADAALKVFKQDLKELYDAAAPESAAWFEEMQKAKDFQHLYSLVKSANYIRVSDTGHGMSKADLREIYLTIGTRHRREEKESLQKTGRGRERPILGEKGLGRLSAMRLGQQVEVKTTRSGEANWNMLEIDWSRFSHDSNEYVEDVAIEPHAGTVKEGRNEQGTIITITALNAKWIRYNVVGFAKDQAAKFNNPFEADKRYKIILRFNDELIPILDFDRMVLNNAHAHVTADFNIEDGEPLLRGRVYYKQAKRERTFSLQGAQILSASDADLETLKHLGPFTMEAFWFNRRLLQKKEDGGVSIGQLVNEWSGGLMLFRDGFRVLPYGNQDDDWLDLDRKALASQGYKVNRKQLIGRVEISSMLNPSLTDQTNREGLRDNSEKSALTHLLKHVLEGQLRQFLMEVDKEQGSQLGLSFDVLGERVATEKVSLRKNLAELKKRRPPNKQEELIFDKIDSAVNSLETMMEEAQTLADQFEKGRSEVIHLAGLGLMVEFVAHELNRATQHALGTLGESSHSQRISGAALKNLELQLKTLQKRLSSLDPSSVTGRNRKESFDLGALAQDVLDGHAAEFKRHRIEAPKVKAIGGSPRLQVNMVKGMVIQILENLLSNSIYWIKQEQRLRRGLTGKIEIAINPILRTLQVTDNGPGVSNEVADNVFQAFFTTKPPGLGKGLGLYISKELAHYHEAELELSPERLVHKDKYNSFVLTLPK